jgi:hypothetical protein
MKPILPLLFLVLFAGIPSAQAQPVPGSVPPIAVQNQCGWYVIFLCSRNRQDAVVAAQREGALVIDSSSADFAAFRRGWYCAAFGPAERSPALEQLATVRRRYVSAYAKASC